MQISSTEEYGLRCALALARSYHNQTVQLSASQISQLEGISVQYVSKLLHLFKKVGLVEASRGSRGGFSLAKNPRELSVKEVFLAIQSTQKNSKKEKDFCKSHSGQSNTCVHLNDCSVRPMWTVLFSYFDVLLEKIFLSDLMGPESTMQIRVESLAGQQIQRINERLSHERHILERSKLEKEKLVNAT